MRVVASWVRLKKYIYIHVVSESVLEENNNKESGKITLALLKIVNVSVVATTH